MPPDLFHSFQDPEYPGRTAGHPSHGKIPDTISSLVRAASADDPEARNEIARLYRGPVLFWLAGHGCPPELAEDLAQEFLAALVNEKTGFIRQYDPDKARLRTYLKVAARNLLGTHRAKANAVKRGGGIPHLTLEMVGQLEVDLSGDAGGASGSGLDYAWAHTIHALVCEQMEKESQADPRRNQIYQALQPFFLEPSIKPDYTRLAREFQQEEAALRTQFSRLKQRFLRFWIREVRRIVTDPSEVVPEAQYLLGLLIQRQIPEE